MQTLYEEIKKHDKVYQLLYMHLSDDEIVEDQIYEIPTTQIEDSRNPDHAIYIWGFPGPDLDVFTREDFGKTWAYDRQTLIDNNPNTHTKNNMLRHEAEKVCEDIGWSGLYPTKYSFKGDRLLIVHRGSLMEYEERIAVFKDNVLKFVDPDPSECKRRYDRVLGQSSCWECCDAPDVRGFRPEIVGA